MNTTLMNNAIMKIAEQNTTTMDRKLMVRAIMELAGDELETIEDAMQIAMETDQQLVNRLIGIALYYKNECDKF
jgi:hypothetical protein